MQAKVSVLIPAHNEEKTIQSTINALMSIPEVEEIIVVDDASCDKTAQAAADAGAMVVSLIQNLGKGGAMSQGIHLINSDIVALVDADLGTTASDVSKLIDPVISGNADMTIAKFPRARKKGGFGLVKGLAIKGIKMLTGMDVLAPLSGQRVMRKAVIDALGGFESGYGVEVGMTIDAVRKGYKIQEIDVNMTHSETGRDLKGFLHRGKQFFHVAQALARRMVLR